MNYAEEMVFTNATSGVKVIVTDNVGRTTTATTKAMVNMDYLESVEIGDESLCCMQDDVMYLNRDLVSFDMEKSVVAHNAMRVVDCPKLRTISTGLHACWKYSALVICGGCWRRR